MKIFTYGIYRHGSNAYNQSMCDKEIVCSVDARNRREAVEKALELESEGEFTLYANQHLSAIPWSKVPRCDEEDLALKEAYR